MNTESTWNHGMNMDSSAILCGFHGFHMEYRGRVKYCILPLLLILSLVPQTKPNALHKDLSLLQIILVESTWILCNLLFSIDSRWTADGPYNSTWTPSGLHLESTWSLPRVHRNFSLEFNARDLDRLREKH